MDEAGFATVQDMDGFVAQANVSSVSKKSLHDSTIWLFDYKGIVAEVALGDFLGMKFVSFSVHLFPLPTTNQAQFCHGLLRENGKMTGVYFGISHMREGTVVLTQSQFAFDLTFGKVDSLLDVMGQAAMAILSDPEDFQRNLGLL